MGIGSIETFKLHGTSIERSVLDNGGRVHVQWGACLELMGRYRYTVRSRLSSDMAGLELLAAAAAAAAAAGGLL